MNRSFFVSIILLAAAAPAYASVVVTEIMYDLADSDAGREWIEIKNTGSSQVDLTVWKLFEADTNHGIAAAGSQMLALPAGAYAIVADNVEKFLIDYPNFSGILFDSSFSLSNTGEAISIRNPELADIDSVAYASSLGAAGDGNSLQKVGNEWIAALPTPGAPNADDPVQPPAVSGEASEPVVSGGGGPVEMADSFSKIRASAGADRTVLAGAETVFEGSAEGFVDATADKIRFHWNFGDGKTGEGNKVAHVFSFPGVYEVFLTVSFAGVSASDSAKITVVENPVVISEIKYGKFIEIYNASARKIDFSKFGVSIGGAKPFYFPDGTFLPPWAYLALEPSLLGFEIPQSGEIKILYPNGKVLLSSIYPNFILGEKESLSLVDDAWTKSKITPGAKNELVKIETAPFGKTPPDWKKPLGSSKPGFETAKKPGFFPPGGLKEPDDATEISLASASYPSEYVWLFFGLGLGILGGLVFFVAKRYLV
ncbi:hypothetical protein A3C77_02150 [Candidatus Giovannonibacteria bacterium RIFCSPHIGHO2_02_FULL_45_13]|uniref:PKD domain-containing protein n=1 Tax=Candidatus Giovannonibacteria bacterium RIFCSPHIGHO2_01_FULL_45_23 TaxID=1798325 RepID=A0A1F5VIJ5_9BACT|nr:MAG: hypothetical protein A2834_02275 [Candidatus Giovannonibacteria bacterium RIFCSPHIGHO2_01_FULL_45_23]OGF75874.1 MAG: hypothetical protein A3C77_02150 [Candidatus Giovannonibacteria bacterium RIFCSPHIGHO2_02_FULL_45_13]